MPAIIPETTGNANSTAESSSYRMWYVALFVSGFLLRFGFVLWKKTYLGSANDSVPFGVEICSIANHIARGEGFSSPFRVDTGATAWVAPVYPYFVSVVFRLFGAYSSASAILILGLQCLMGAATGIAIHALGRRTFGPWSALCAAWIWALSPIFFRWTVSWIWDFGASALLLALAFIITLDTAQRGTTRLWLLLGAIWAVIALTNPALLSIMPFSFIYLVYVQYKERRVWMKQFVLAGLVFAVLVSPWLIRNDLVFGHPVFFRSNYWFEFHLGNYHFSNGMGFAGRHPAGNPAELAKYVAWGEQQYIAFYKNDALAFVKQYPAEFLDLTRHRVWWFWDGTPLLYQAREWWQPWEFWPLSTLGWLGLLFAVTRRLRGWLLFSAALLIYPLPYYFSYAVAKYRHAIEPELLLLSVYFAGVLFGEIRAVLSRRKSTASPELATAASSS